MLARLRAEGRVLTPEERDLIFEPSKEAAAPAARQYEDVEEMDAAALGSAEIAELEGDFFPELGGRAPAGPRLVRGVIFDFDYTLARPARPLDELMDEGARAADAYMRAAGMDLPEDFHTNIVEARRFAAEKSRDEQEEHIADDAMSFLLQFFGYPASRMDPDVLRRAVDIFYAPEMSAWRLAAGAKETLAALQGAGYKLAVLANYPCDRVFQRIIDYLGIRPHLDLCVCSAAVEYRKPDVRFFEMALERWDALPYEVVVVGDALAEDIAGGIELGALTVLARLGTTAQVEHDNEAAAGQVQADAEIRELAALPALVQQWATA